MPFAFQCLNPSKNANTFCWVKSYSCCRHAWDCICHSVYTNRLDVPFSLFTFRNPGGLISLRHYPIFARSSLKYPVIGKYHVSLCIRPLILEIHRVSNQLFVFLKLLKSRVILKNWGNWFDKYFFILFTIQCWKTKWFNFPSMLFIGFTSQFLYSKRFQATCCFLNPLTS